LTSVSECKRFIRFVAAGSVDDGKSTLIGRLLFDSDGIYEDQLASIRKFSRRGGPQLDFSLITDGLKAEREQAITIDVAYKYFSTSRTKFIIADVPGHEQYTGNMATGASTADLAVLLVDARKGVLEQTKRHAYIAYLLGIRYFIFAINKMDLVDFDRSRFQAIRGDCLQFTRRFNSVTTNFIPVSATEGDNVVNRSHNMPWYQGLSLLSFLDTVEIRSHVNTDVFRFSIQKVIRPSQDFRGYAGRVASGTIKRGQEVLAVPSMQKTEIDSIVLHPRELPEAHAPLSVVLTIRDHIDLCRGDMLVDLHKPPTITTTFNAKLIWMSRTPLRVNTPYLIRHGNQTVCGTVVRVLSKTDINTFDEFASETLAANDIGIVEIETHKPVLCDLYCENRSTGNFILIDPANGDTAGAAMIMEMHRNVSANDLVLDHRGGLQKGLTVWFTGLSGAGKSSIAKAVHTELLARGIRSELLDADDVRKHLNSDLGFSKEDRNENVRRIGFIASLLTRNGITTLVCAISPYRSVREEVRRTIGSFYEVYVAAPLEVCERRDPKGLYKRARHGEIHGFTGIDDPYEEPLAPELRCCTETETLKESSEKVLEGVLCRVVQTGLKPEFKITSKPIEFPAVIC
jgi:bifunctional enzyme CysN/CysC